VDVLVVCEVVPEVLAAAGSAIPPTARQALVTSAAMDPRLMIAPSSAPRSGPPDAGVLRPVVARTAECRPV
jgi:hypothetical protein